MKKILIIVVSLLAFIIIGLGSIYALFSPQIRSAQSAKQEAEQMYSITFVGNDGIDDFIAQGGASSTAEAANYTISFITHGLVKSLPIPQEFGCSFISAPDSTGNELTARNFDWPNCYGDIVVVKNNPTNGYTSVSTTQLTFLAFGDDFQPLTSMQNRIMLLACLYAPQDGFNEKGLYVADLVAGDQDVTNQQTERPDLTTSTAIRLLLDKAATTQEAVDLLNQFDMHSDVGFAHHLAISDTDGKSVVVEWVDDKMVVVETPLCTNHYVANTHKKGSSIYYEDSHRRYHLLQQALDTKSIMTEQHITEAIATVASSEYTRWTVVYNRATETATYYQYANFKQPIIIKLN